MKRERVNESVCEGRQPERGSQTRTPPSWLSATKQSQLFTCQLATSPGICNCPPLKQQHAPVSSDHFGWKCVSGRMVWDPSREALSSGGSQFPAAVERGVAISGSGTKAVTLPHKGKVAMCPALLEMLTVSLFCARDFRPA